MFLLITLLSMLTITLTSNVNVIVDANEIKSETASDQDFEALGLHYGKYLKDVVEALDKDQKFTETIKNMDANDIKSGKVAEQLKHVHEDVRNKLNDLKYLEIKRLRDLATRKNEMETLGQTYHGGADKRRWRTVHAGMKLPEHLGSDATHFDMDDLHKLMVAATNDLEKLDKERREDFKTYELEKEWQFQERIKMMNETEKQEAIKLRQEMKKKHDEHAKVHEPGSKAQFEDVWEKADNLPKNEFDPKTFFALHDTNSDNYWDPDEVKKLLNIEIKKMYDPNNPEDDPNEMEEEFERMREHVYKEIDADRDGLISQKEFLDYSKRPEFKTDHGWDDINKKDAYSKQDYEEYVKNREKILKNSHGYYDPWHYQNQPANLHLPEYGFGMPHGANPAHYYHVDPNHPQAQQILAQQNMAYQQNLALQHQAYQQPGAVPHPQAGYAQQGQQQYYQPPVQGSVPQLQQQPAAGQINYQQQQQAPVPQVNQQQQGYQQPQQQQNQQAPNQYYQAPQPAQNNQQQFQQQKPPMQQPQSGYQQPQAVPQQQQQQAPSQAPAANFQQPPVQQTQQQSNQNYQPVK